jgi:putative transposase
MARRPRFHLPFSTYHVMLRGNDGQSIFFSNEDRSRMCLLIQEGIERFNHSIHSFCFMNNHIHLAIQVNEASISRIIHHLAFRYTRYINKKYKRKGHLFQGRFKSIIVDGNQYLKELIRYIHLNPVRAGLVDQPEKYVWSSHRAYLMLDEYTWITCDKVLKNFGSNLKEVINNYESFILKGIGIETELDFKSGYFDGILGDKEFVDEFLNNVEIVKKREINLLELVSKLSKRFNLCETALSSPGKNRLESQVRAILALFVRESENLSIEELAIFLARDPSGLSKLANRLKRKCLQSSTLAAEIEELRKWIYN